jgi:hypothetical protein
MGSFIDLTGKVFGRLTVVNKSEKRGTLNRIMWNCKCECGNYCVVNGSTLKVGDTKSCGCLFIESVTMLGKASKTHGMRHTREYKSWSEAKQRCHNPKNGKFGWYGARGITVCDEWINDFQAFFNHIGPKPEKFELDRIDNSKGYEPGNVRWISKKGNLMNRRNTVKVFFMGEEITLDEYSKIIGISYKAAYARLKHSPHLIAGHAKKSAIGELNGNAKLKNHEVEEIRNSIDKTSNLCKIYGVSKSLIQGIRSGKLRTTEASNRRMDRVTM